MEKNKNIKLKDFIFLFLILLSMDFDQEINREICQHIPQLLGAKEATQYLRKLLEIPWKVIQYGVAKRMLPRKIIRYGDDGITHPVIEELKKLVEFMFQKTVRGVWFTSKIENSSRILGMFLPSLRVISKVRPKIRGSL
jgi:hypothetical protein